MTDFPYVHRERVRFRDCDAMGHVNNAVYSTYLEESRIGVLGGLGDFILARVEIDFRSELRAGEQVEVRTRCPRVGTKSFDLQHVISADGRVVAEARSVLVSYDYGRSESIAVPERCASASPAGSDRGVRAGGSTSTGSRSERRPLGAAERPCLEAVAAQLERRAPCDLYHSALWVRVPEGRFVIEQAPAGRGSGAERGVVAEGPVGSHWAGRFRLFRYEVRRWRGGSIPDVDEAVDSPRLLSSDPAVAQRVLDLVPHVPTAVWGRDELRAGEMWNSNSTIAWGARTRRPAPRVDRAAGGGRAPGWRAGTVVARRG